MKKYIFMEKSYINLSQGDIIELPDNAIVFNKFTNQSGKSEWTTYIQYIIPVDDIKEEAYEQDK